MAVDQGFVEDCEGAFSARRRAREAAEVFCKRKRPEISPVHSRMSSRRPRSRLVKLSHCKLRRKAWMEQSSMKPWISEGLSGRVFSERSRRAARRSKFSRNSIGLREEMSETQSLFVQDGRGSLFAVKLRAASRGAEFRSMGSFANHYRLRS
jgi:hypothetical protein